MTDKIVVFTTCDSQEAAQALARSLVQARLAACVNIVPGLTSVYWWQGAIEEAGEFQLVIKSSRPLFEKLRDHILRQHNYATPELIALAVVDGSESYLEWVDRELRLEAGA